MNKVIYTHKGWFGICPIYIAEPDSDSPNLDERHWLFIPLFELSALMFDVLFWVATSVNQDYQPTWPLCITGELKTPIERAVP